MTVEEIQEQIEKIDKLRGNSQFVEAKSIALELLGNKVVQNDAATLGRVFTILGIVHKNLSDYSKALEYYLQSLQIYEGIEKKDGIAINLGHIGIVYHYLSDFAKAIEYYDKSLLIYEEIGNKFSIAATLANIGMVYETLQENTKAFEYLNKALSINQEIGNKSGIANNLGNLGLVLNNLQNDSKALENLENALDICNEIGDKVGIANILGNIGNKYLQMTNYNDALEYLENALQINEEIENKNGIVFNLGNIGNVYLKLLDYSKALECLNKAYSLSIEIGAKNTSIGLLKGLSNVYEEIGDIEKAYSYYKQFIEIKDYIQSEDIKNKALLFDQRRKIEEDEKARQLKLARFQEQEKILHNILPVNIADRILNQESFIADHFQSVSVLFMDLVGFTSLSSIAPPKQLVYLLDTIFTKADEVVESFGLEKIKTIGDGYLAVANVTTPLENHQKATALSAIKLLKTMKDFTVNIPSELGNTDWTKDMKDIKIRIGIHSGEVIAGIIGKNKYTYDLWGDAVNVASRMESHSEPGRIHISDEFAKSIEHHPEFSLIPRGEITVKGKGTMNTFWLEKAI